MKVFISYASEDRSTAGLLDTDLHDAGATTFLYGRSETAGVDAWDEIWEWIEDSDAFVALISPNALGSTPVREEIKWAHYCHINSAGKKPAKLIPAIIEAGTEPPKRLRMFATLDLTEYRNGLTRLVGHLGLEQPAAPIARGRPAPDFEALIARPVVSPVTELDFGLNVMQLAAPTLTVQGGRLSWNPVFGAQEYVIERAADESFERPERVWSGKETSHFVMWSPMKHYRVKATGGLLLDSPWSNSVDVTSPLLLFSLRAPALRASANRTGVTLEWSPVENATGYVLARSVLISMTPFSVLYEGPDTRYTHRGAGRGYAYRVKAKGSRLHGDSPWSKPVSPR
jgi:hypothetical protein